MFYNHLCWLVVLSSFFLISTLVSFFVTISNLSFFLSFDIFYSWFFSFEFSLVLDWMSLWFMSTVLLISSVISIYSFFYMSPYFKSSLFLWATFLFILSMLFVIVMSNMFYSMLGWDGLGLVSFFLIVFYQNTASISSGLFTLLINRLGDGFFLVSVALLGISCPDMFSLNSFITEGSLPVFFLVLTFITNSAIYPFSSWLPMAMAAPTPISALVHSSTLVTAGLYLIMRFSYLIYSHSFLMYLLLSASLFTSFYAGLNTVFEIDLNKLIALSTLSHLGFIGMSLSCGLLSLAFFHLLVHALFKSLLFICMGDIIINLNHSQDIRFLSSGRFYTPFSVFTMYVSLLNLLGMPSISGFFSNDIILEAFSYTNSSYFFIGVVYFNVFFTYFYTLQLFYYSFSSNKLTPLYLFHSQSFIHVALMFCLAVVSILFGSVFLDLVMFSSFFLVVPSSLNMFPIFLSSCMFLFLLVFISFPKVYSRGSHYVLSNMLALSPLLMSVSSSFYYSFSFVLVKDVELGSLNHALHSSLVSSLSSCFNFFFGLYRFQPFYVLLACLFLFGLSYFCNK